MANSIYGQGLRSRKLEKNLPQYGDRRSPSMELPCQDSNPPNPPYGSGSGLWQRNQQKQASNHSTFLTTFEALDTLTTTPWSYLGANDPDFPEVGTQGANIFQNAQRVLEFGGQGPPQTYVVSLVATEYEVVNDDPSTIQDTSTAFSQTEGRRYTRLQALIEWSTGTGTQLVIPLDISGGVVFRVFGTIGRVWVLKYPQASSGFPAPAPTTVGVSNAGPVEVPAGISTLTTVQSSVMSNYTPMEGFPGAWQLTAPIVQSLGINRVRVPPFARKVQVSQAPGGSAIPTYDLITRDFQPCGSLTVNPGSRTTRHEYIPGQARFVRNPLPATPAGTASVVFDVSQF